MCIRIFSAVIDRLSLWWAMANISLTAHANNRRAKKDKAAGLQIIYAAMKSDVGSAVPCTRNVRRYCDGRIASCAQLMSAIGGYHVDIWIAAGGFVYLISINLDAETASVDNTAAVDLDFGDIDLTKLISAITAP